MSSPTPVPSLPVPTGILVYDANGTLSYADDTARGLLDCADDAPRDACRDAAEPVVGRALSSPDIAAYVTDGPAGRILVHSDAVPDGGPIVVRLRNADAVRDLSAAVRNQKRVSLLESMYRAYTHDARNPVIASQLQIGILRELDAEALANRSERFADTIERHLDAVSDALTDLIDEIVDRNDEPGASANTILERVARLARPYARKRSTSIDVTPADDEMTTLVSLSAAKRALLGLVAYAVGTAESGTSITLDAKPDGESATITLASPSLGGAASDDAFTTLLHAARDDLSTFDGRVELHPDASPPSVTVMLPRKG